mgnify:CR=1 FL=1|jgi:hypothetical protein
MSLIKIQKIFSDIPSCEAWSLQLLQIKTSRKKGTTYIGREIQLSPKGTLQALVSEIAERYGEEKKGILCSYTDVRPYDGSAIANVIYKLEADNELIQAEYAAFIKAIASPDRESDPLEFKTQAYLLKGIVTSGGEEHRIKLISLQNPVTTLKHKYYQAAGTFKKMSDKVITLRTSMDVLICDNTVYMLTLSGEKLFHMERAYRMICSHQMDEIEKCGMVEGFEAFRSIAESGHNPRKFVSFDNNYFQKLKNVGCRRRMAHMFGIPLVGDRFALSEPKSAEKWIKLLCRQGMIDPFENCPMEVVGSKKWG